jgi:hypothetical protein
LLVTGLNVSFLATTSDGPLWKNDTMTSATRQSSPERLWSTADGTECILEERDTAPMYIVSLIRNDEVVRQQRFFAKATAEMMALGWHHRTNK